MNRVLNADPNPGTPIVIESKPIGFRIIPDTFSLNDPVFLRHVLAIISVVYNMFHVYLCWRQMKVCVRRVSVPSQMINVMSKELFQECRIAELLKSEQKLVSYLIDAALSVLELYLSVYQRLFQIIIFAYGRTGNIPWVNMAYVALLVVYLVIRTLPSLLFNKIILEPLFEVDRMVTTPLVGILCTLILFIALVQVILIPMTLVFWEIHNSSSYFVLWIWLFVFVASALGLLLLSFGCMPCLGKSVPLPKGNLLDSLNPVLSHFGFPPNHVYILQTHHHIKASAYALGCCCCKNVYLLDSLLLDRTKYLKDLHEEPDTHGLEDEDVVAIVGHELAHWRLCHVFKSFILIHVFMLIYMGLFSTVFSMKVLYEAIGFSRDFYPHMVGYWVVYKYVMPPYLTIARWIVFYFLRHFEYAADNYIYQLNLFPTLKKALLKLFADNMMYPYADHWYLMWHNRKPSCLQRIKNLHRIDFPTYVSKVELI